MDDFHTESTDFQPEISASKTEIFISGRSMMEDAAKFYDHLINWTKGLNHQVTAKFDLSYFNSSSAKQILRLLLLLEEQNPKNGVVWIYPKGNTVLENRGKELEIILDLPFQYRTK